MRRVKEYSIPTIILCLMQFIAGKLCDCYIITSRPGSRPGLTKEQIENENERIKKQWLESGSRPGLTKEQIENENERIKKQWLESGAVPINRNGTASSKTSWTEIALFGSIGGGLVLILLVGLVITCICKIRRWKSFTQGLLPSITTDEDSSLEKKSKPLGRVDRDRKLAHSAQLFHNQHRKQKMTAMNKFDANIASSPQNDYSGAEDDHTDEEGEVEEEEVEGGFTVNECPP